MKKEQIRELSKESLDSINKFSLFPMVIYDDDCILFSNEKFDTLISYEEFNQVKKENGFDLERINKSSLEFSIKDNRQIFKWYELTYQIVIFDNHECILACLIDITTKKETENQINKISKLRALMLEVTQSILQQDDLDNIFRLILKNSVKAMDHASLGTILIREGEFLKVASYVGFTKSILDLNLPLKESFLYTETNGRLDCIVTINDLIDFKGHQLVHTCLGEELFIKSTVTAPIYINHNFFGMINIDSVEIDAFDEIDIRSMEFLKTNIEIALSNQFLYQQKVFLARYDTLTKIYNRCYFEEQFNLILEKSIKYKETFCLVVFDIDGLKKTNDTHGHLAGDEVIKRVAEGLDENKGNNDLIARIGGDEFIGVYLHSNDELLSVKFESILGHMKKNPIRLDNQEISCYFSFGVACFPQDGETLDVLFEKADTRMYRMKKGLI